MMGRSFAHLDKFPGKSMETKPIVISNQLNGGQFFFGASDARRGMKKKDRVLQKIELSRPQIGHGLPTG